LVLRPYRTFIVGFAVLILHVLLCTHTHKHALDDPALAVPSAPIVLVLAIILFLTSTSVPSGGLLSFQP
jgi:hypothetical protein